MKHGFTHSCLMVCLMTLLSACGKADAPAKPVAPAQVIQPVVEAQLNTITLTPAAVQRLGIELATAESKVVIRTRVMGGQLVSPTGQDAMVAAPFAGIVIASNLPTPGTQLRQGAAVLGLLPINASDAGGSDDNLNVRQAEFQAASNRLERAEKLLAARGASVEEVERARSEKAQAAAALNLIQAQRAVAQGKALSVTAQLAPMPITSPQAGVLQAVLVANGQTVAAGQALFQVQSQHPLWVKVPVFSGAVSEIDPKASARISALGSTANISKVGTPIKGPMTTHAGTAALDLFYRIDNTDATLRAGEQVRVALPLRQATQALVVPHSAIYVDMYGGSWLYESVAEQVFVRRRVEVRDVVGDQAVLGRGLAAGAKVVTVGVAELAGTEFGVAK